MFPPSLYCGARFRLELRDVVRPERLVRPAFFGDGLDAIPDHRTGVLIHRVLDHALVVIDRQSQGRNTSLTFALSD